MDSIKLHGVEFYAYHGVLESEKELGQTFSIDCEFLLDTFLCGDDIEKTVNYGDVALEIVDFATKNRFDLLESLANGLVRHLLARYELIREITVTVHKPHAPIATKFSDVTLTITRGWKTCYLGIGSNLGEREDYLNMVFQAISNDSCVREIARSDYLETEPYGVTDQPKFLNGAVKIETFYTPMELLRFCKKIEKDAGRTVTRRWGERTLDVDILLYGDEIVNYDTLKIPHPEMHIRDFVLKPLEELDPYIIHSVKGLNVREMLAKL